MFLLTLVSWPHYFWFSHSLSSLSLYTSSSSPLPPPHPYCLLLWFWLLLFLRFISSYLLYTWWFFLPIFLDDFSLCWFLACGLDSDMVSWVYLTFVVVWFWWLFWFDWFYLFCMICYYDSLFLPLYCIFCSPLSFFFLLLVYMLYYCKYLIT